MGWKDNHKQEHVLRKQSDRPTAVVLGLGQNGMATARSLGRLGIPVVGIDSDLEQPGAQTRFCQKIYSEDFARGGTGLVDTLVDLGRHLSTKGVLIPSGDLNVGVVSDHREALSPFFHFALPSKEVVELFLNKKAFLQLAIREGLPIPKTFLTDNTDIKHIANEVQYPCLIKPFLHADSAWQGRFDTRLFLADSAEMLRSLFDVIYPIHQDLMIQEYMPGADSQLFWGVTYLNSEGEPLAVWTGRKLRQYPRGFGTATFAESRREPWVAQEAIRILQTMGHRGYGVVEFKKDRRDGRLKITEPTGGRTWFPHSLVTRSGINLPYILYQDLLGESVEPQTEFRTGLKWVHEERDVKTVFLYFLPEGKLTLWSWLRSLRGQRVYAYASWDDPRPLLSSLFRVVLAGFRTIRRRLFTKNPEQARQGSRMKNQVRPLLLGADPTVGHRLRQVSVD